jgi:hypothetical protein
MLDRFRNKGRLTKAQLATDPIKYDANLLILRPLYFDDTRHTTLEHALDLLSTGDFNELGKKPVIRGKLHLATLFRQLLTLAQACSGHMSCFTPLLLLALVGVHI